MPYDLKEDLQPPYHVILREYELYINFYYSDSTWHGVRNIWERVARWINRKNEEQYQNRMRNLSVSFFIAWGMHYYEIKSSRKFIDTVFDQLSMDQRKELEQLFVIKIEESFKNYLDENQTSPK